MAQNREKEETLELKKVPTTETLTPLCTENCKIPAPSTAQPRSGPGSISPDPICADPCSNAPSRASKRPREEDAAPSPPLLETTARVADADVAVKKKTVNRCSGCKKRVGLTGFTCRCGEIFCAVHRYSDRHDCGFDYKAAGRETIARENPVVRAAKILKI